MRSFGRTVTRAVTSCLTALLALASLSALGGEPPTVEVKSRGEEKPFDFEPGGYRDPFAFHKKLDRIAARSTPIGPVSPTLTPPNPLDPAEIQKRREKAERCYGEAQQAFMLETGRDTRPSDVVSKCDKGLEELKDVGDLSKYPDQAAVRDLVQIREKLLELRRAGEQVRQRREAERRFRDMNLRLTGVVAQQRHSQAIVNGKIVGKGEVVATSESNDVVVDEILPDQVIFLFQGYKMSLTLSDMPARR